MQKHVGHLANLPLITQEGESVNAGFCIRLFSVRVPSSEICFKDEKGIHLIRRETTGCKKKKKITGPCQRKRKPRC